MLDTLQDISKRDTDPLDLTPAMQPPGGGTHYILGNG